jgi:hypothetical protein
MTGWFAWLLPDICATAHRLRHRDVPNCGVQGTAREEPSMDQVSTIGLNIATNVFQVHGLDETGETPKP